MKDNDCENCKYELEHKSPACMECFPEDSCFEPKKEEIIMKTKHFQLSEIYRGDNIHHTIGTIPNVVDSQAGREAFNVRFNTAIEEHFDIHNFTYDELPDLFDGSEYHDIMIGDDGDNYEIRIAETWLY